MNKELLLQIAAESATFRGHLVDLYLKAQATPKDLRTKIIQIVLNNKGNKIAGIKAIREICNLSEAEQAFPEFEFYIVNASGEVNHLGLKNAKELFEFLQEKLDLN